MITLLRIGENILDLRRKKGITQDELAEFLGVTKASVSKWETKQSYPDIMLLPQIANFFDISIDSLMGYEPQLSPEQIKKCYQDLAEEFATKAFDETMDKSRKLVKEYYACYEFLLQIGILWLNHFMLAKTSDEQKKIIMEIASLCNHIEAECGDMAIKSDAMMLRAFTDLQLGNVSEVIEKLKGLNDPKSLKNQMDGTIIMAYKMLGDFDTAKLKNQVFLYTNLINFIGNSVSRLDLEVNDIDKCEVTIERVQKIIDIYEIDKLHPNVTAQFYYQSAVCYCMASKKEQALEMIKQFIERSKVIINEGTTLCSDSYFDRLDEWFEEFVLGSKAPRSIKMVKESVKQALENTQLSILFDDKEFIKIKDI